jgi:transcriptional regulator with XRE-family HTH domain
VRIATGAQIRAARAMLGWTRQDLANAAGLHRNSVAYWEAVETIKTSYPPHACELIREALRKAGVAVFTDPAPGVCFVPRAQKYDPIKRGVSGRHNARARDRRVSDF